MRFACDTGGTFTDLAVEDADGIWRTYKAAKVAADPVAGVLDALALAAGFRLPSGRASGTGQRVRPRDQPCDQCGAYR